MSNKNLSIFEGSRPGEKVELKGTMIVLRNKATGKVIFRGSNKMLVSGSETNALKSFNFDPTWSSVESHMANIPTYDSVIPNITEINGAKPLTAGILSGIGDFNPSATSGTDFYKKCLYEYFTERVCLFAVGIDGCGIENSRIYKVQNTKWIAPTGYVTPHAGMDQNITNCLIPFKMTSTDLTSSERELYFGRAEDATGQISYYFKGFDSAPTLIRRYSDDSSDLAMVADVWKDARLSEADMVVELKMSVSTTDCRQYFTTLTGESTAKINTISLLTAIPYQDSNGQLFYKNIRPYTKFNFANESLIDASKGIDISYYLYY